MQKTFHLSNRELLWGETWIDLSMKMRDMPYYDYSTSKEEERVLKGTNDILKKNFSQFIKKPSTP